MNKVQEYWIEQGSFVRVVHDKISDLNGWTIKEPIHVIEISAYKKQQAIIDKLTDLSKRLDTAVVLLRETHPAESQSMDKQLKETLKEVEAMTCSKD